MEGEWSDSGSSHSPIELESLQKQLHEKEQKIQELKSRVEAMKLRLQGKRKEEKEGTEARDGDEGSMAASRGEIDKLNEEHHGKKSEEPPKP
ncbi:hypothetical protein SAY87_013654 [Trapa incisa]|uniref:Uncharacterized protein n=2 Tax=Trapa TaxID=22665 RepID=A0AAN7KDW0_TRANT|nr:hypothetical protein SAY86_009027 [Trapa natans]KAK4764216.1 hypothetical protein SAY87_013654 [Trapa incisa]